MDKEQFIATLAKRLETKAGLVESVVDATLAEVLTPSIFGTAARAKFFGDNNCNNNCRPEVASQSPTLGGAS
jgi:hypothetical protein